MAKQRTCLTLLCKRAFTLIEILVVLFIIGFFFSYAATKVFRKDAKIKDTFSEISSLNRRLYTASRMHKKNYRMVFKLSRRNTTFWAEKENPKNEYEIADSILKKNKKIHRLLSIESMEASYWDEEKTRGLAFIYYYPKGVGQETAVHFRRTDRNGNWTLYFPPLKREVEVINKDISLNELTGN